MGEAKIELTRESIRPIIAQYNAGKFVDLLSMKSGGPSGPSDQTSELESLASALGSFQILSDSQIEEEEASSVWALKNGSSAGYTRRSGEVGSEEVMKQSGPAAVSSNNNTAAAPHTLNCESSNVLRTGEEDWEGGEAYFSGSDYEDDVNDSNNNREYKRDGHGGSKSRRQNFGSAMEVLEDLNTTAWLPAGPNSNSAHLSLQLDDADDADDADDDYYQCSVQSQVDVLTGPCDEGEGAECSMWSGGDAYFSNSEDEDLQYTRVQPGSVAGEAPRRQERQHKTRTGKGFSDKSKSHCILQWDGGDAYYSESDNEK